MQICKLETQSYRGDHKDAKQLQKTQNNIVF